MRQTNNVDKARKKIFKPTKFKFGPELHKYLTTECEEYRELKN